MSSSATSCPGAVSGRVKSSRVRVSAGAYSRPSRSTNGSSRPVDWWLSSTSRYSGSSACATGVSSGGTAAPAAMPVAGRQQANNNRGLARFRVERERLLGGFAIDPYPEVTAVIGRHGRGKRPAHRLARQHIANEAGEQFVPFATGVDPGEVGQLRVLPPAIGDYQFHAVAVPLQARGQRVGDR